MDRSGVLEDIASFEAVSKLVYQLHQIRESSKKHADALPGVRRFFVDGLAKRGYEGELGCFHGFIDVSHDSEAIDYRWTLEMKGHDWQGGRNIDLTSVPEGSSPVSHGLERALVHLRRHRSQELRVLAPPMVRASPSRGCALCRTRPEPPT